MSKSNLVKAFTLKIIRFGYVIGILRIPLVQSLASGFYARFIYPIACHFSPDYAHQTIQIGGCSFTVSLADQGGLGLATLGQNTFMARIFKDMVKPGMCILDCGAYVGYYTVLGSRLVGEKGKVIAVEPHPANFALLQRNVVLNKCTNVITLQAGLSDTAGTASLFVNKRDSTAHSIYSLNSEKSGRSICIQTLRADDICAGEVVEVVKIDVEGAELAVLKGMEKVLAQKQLALFIEHQPKNLLRAGVEPAMLIDLLVTRGFTLFHIDEAHRILQPLESPPRIEALRKMKKEQNLLGIKGISIAGMC